MSDNGYVKINKHIDVLPYFGNWEMSSVIVFFATMSAFIMVSDAFFMQCLAILFGAIATNVHIKLKENAVKGFAKHLAYRIGLLKTKTLMPSHLRFFVGA